ncbi:MAG: TonB-dependent receptor plug domain-containing protein [Gemmatimonadetes bacterium]|nr:TonB-dependent receptor plug domain-containing protein [Gemmatimonadota bacterium]
MPRPCPVPSPARLARALALASSLGVASTVAAQGGAARELAGVVRDPAGMVLEGVTVEAGGQVARTNGRGTFLLQTAEVDSITLVIRQVGFTPLTVRLGARDRQWDTVLVHLARAPQGLDAVAVSAPRALRPGIKGFEERRTRGAGTFVTREEILARNTTRTSEVLRLKRGINVVQGKVRFVSYTGSRGTVCQPNLWVDGARVRGGEVDEITATDIEGIELYPSFSSVPSEFTPLPSAGPPCGTIVIWTRSPGSPGR